MPIDQTYAEQMRDKTGMFAAWFPNAAIAIGDYGTVKGPLFAKLAHLEDVDAKSAPAKAAYDISINADLAINTDAKAAADAGVSSGKALLEVKFHTAAAVSFSAPDAVITSVWDLLALGQRLVALDEAGQWQRKYFIVIEVVTVSKATILVSQDAGAEMKFEVEAKTPINPQVMANLDASGSLKMSKGVSTKIIGDGPLTPLFRLARLRSRLFDDPEISVYRGRGQVAPEVLKISGEHYLELYTPATPPSAKSNLA